MSDADLLRCPFCGSPATCDLRGHGNLFAPRCTNDDCVASCGPVAYTSEAKAVIAWNRRASSGHKGRSEGEGMMGLLRFIASDGDYIVVLDGSQIGRVRRSRRSYDHSNGRTYHSWNWSASPTRGTSTFHHSTRAKAARYLLAALDSAAPESDKG